jgi:parallel beta-helix repeat protein
MKKPIVLIAALVAVVAPAAIAVDDARAQASHVSCGDTITADTTLDSDLVDCPTIGIVIGADGITLDLNGHTIDGDVHTIDGHGTPAAGCNPRKEFCDIGVANLGHDAVTVVDGSLQQFAAGVLMEGGKRNKITRNRLFHTGAGIIVGSGSENVITDNDLSKVEDGIRIEKGHDNLVAGNTVADVRAAGIRLGIFRGVGGEDNVVRENLVTPGNDGRAFQADGFRVEKKDDHSLLKGNVAKGAGSNGFDVQSRTTKLTRNRAVGNGDLGIRAVKGVIDGGGNRASGNGDERQCVNVKCH